MFCYKCIDDLDLRIGVIYYGYEFYKKKEDFLFVQILYFDKKINFYIIDKKLKYWR